MFLLCPLGTFSWTNTVDSKTQVPSFGQKKGPESPKFSNSEVFFLRIDNALDFGHVLTFGLKHDIGALRVRKKGVLFYLGRVPSFFFFLLPRFFIGR
jgi:hypothetical protein